MMERRKKKASRRCGCVCGESRVGEKKQVGRGVKTYLMFEAAESACTMGIRTFVGSLDDFVVGWRSSLGGCHYGMGRGKQGAGWLRGMV
jgi:hypothetical protein